MESNGVELSDLCSSASSDSVGSVIYVQQRCNGTDINGTAETTAAGSPNSAAGSVEASRKTAAPPTCNGRHSQMMSTSASKDVRAGAGTGGGGVRPSTLQVVGRRVGSEGSSSTDSEEDDEETALRREENARRQLETSSSSSEEQLAHISSNAIRNSRHLSSTHPLLSKLARGTDSVEDMSSSVPGSAGFGACRATAAHATRRHDSEESSTADHMETARGATQDRIVAIDSGIDNEMVRPSESQAGSADVFSTCLSTSASSIHYYASPPCPGPSLHHSPPSSFLQSPASSNSRPAGVPDRQYRGSGANGAAMFSTPSTYRASFGLLEPVSMPEVGSRTAENQTSIDTNTILLRIHRRDSLSSVISGLHAILVVVLGASLALAEVLSNTLSMATFEGFYLCLFLASLLFLMFLYVSVRRRHLCSTACTSRPATAADTEAPTASDGLLPKLGGDKCCLPEDTFWLRLGVVGCAVGAMVSEGLQLGQFIEMNLSIDCLSFVEVARPVSQILFTFIQLHFVFVYSQACIQRNRFLVRLCLMHLIATNICVWLRVIVLETVAIDNKPRLLLPGRFTTVDGAPKQLTEGSATSVNLSVASHANTTGSSLLYLPLVVYNNIAAATTRLPIQVDGFGMLENSVADWNITASQIKPRVMCSSPDVMAGVVSAVSPYLYPCTIQYSFIVAALFSVVWYNVGQRERIPEVYNARTKADQLAKVGVECSGSSQGLFLGILAVVGTVISILISLVLAARRRSTTLTVDVADVTQLVLCSLAVGSSLLVLVQFRLLQSRKQSNCVLYEILLLSSLAGVVALSIFRCVASQHARNGVAVAANVVTIIHAVMQSTMIAVGLRRRGGNRPSSLATRPGRQGVAFLVVCNMALWLIEVVEDGTVQQQSLDSFYGTLPHRTFSHVCAPLAVFHRFHSVVCLLLVWKRAYQCSSK